MSTIIYNCSRGSHGRGKGDRHVRAVICQRGERPPSGVSTVSHHRSFTVTHSPVQASPLGVVFVEMCAEPNAGGRTLPLNQLWGDRRRARTGEPGRGCAGLSRHSYRPLPCLALPRAACILAPLVFMRNAAICSVTLLARATSLSVSPRPAAFTSSGRGRSRQPASQFASVSCSVLQVKNECPAIFCTSRTSWPRTRWLNGRIRQWKHALRRVR